MFPTCPRACGGGATRAEHGEVRQGDDGREGERAGDVEGEREGERLHRVRRFARSQWGAIFRDVRLRLRAAGPRALPLTLGSCVGILLLLVLEHVQRAGDWVDRLGGVYATLPWWQAILRTPLSLFVPDPSLPIWGLLFQVAIVFGIAETTIGALRTLEVSFLATLAGTWFARWALWAGPLWSAADERAAGTGLRAVRRGGRTRRLRRVPLPGPVDGGGDRLRDDRRSGVGDQPGRIRARGGGDDGAGARGGPRPAAR